MVRARAPERPEDSAPPSRPIPAPRPSGAAADGSNEPAACDRVLAAGIFREEAIRHGFARVGIAMAAEPPGFDGFREWIAARRHAGMSYLEATLGVRADPAAVLPGARSIVSLAFPHGARPVVAHDGSRLARYAAGDDYHGTLRKRAKRVAASAAERIGGGLRWRVCVDSTPIAERSFAAAAGLGWIGKNGCLIDRELGSYFLLAEIVTDADLPPDEPVAELCGSCARCLASCPTQAFEAPGVLDAARCLAYWTIEHRGPIADDVKPALGDRVFGCDVCQEVCPWNAPLSSVNGAPEDAADGGTIPIPTRAEWLAMGKGEWRRRFGASALNRAGRRGLQRNAAISAAVMADPALLPALPALAAVSDRGVADAVRWAGRRAQLPAFPPGAPAALEASPAALEASPAALEASPASLEAAP